MKMSTRPRYRGTEHWHCLAALASYVVGGTIRGNNARSEADDKRVSAPFAAFILLLLPSFPSWLGKCYEDSYVRTVDDVA